MAEPIFPEAAIGPAVYTILGFLLALTGFLAFKLSQLRADDVNKTNFNLQMLKLKKSRIDILQAVVNDPLLQSELPSATNFSKATISQGVKELSDKGLIKRKKRGNSYLIEPDLDRIREKCGKQ